MRAFILATLWDPTPEFAFILSTRRCDALDHCRAQTDPGVSSRSRTVAEGQAWMPRYRDMDICQREHWCLGNTLFAGDGCDDVSPECFNRQKRPASLKAVVLRVHGQGLALTPVESHAPPLWRRDLWNRGFGRGSLPKLGCP